MPIDYEAHWQTLYTAMREAMNDGGYSLVPLYHVTSSSDQGGDPAAPPYVTYRQETERPIGTTGKGNSAVMTTGYMVTARDFELGDALGAISAIVNVLDVADKTLVTPDGYETTDIMILGNQTLFEEDLGVYAQHLRISWERSR